MTNTSILAVMSVLFHFASRAASSVTGTLTLKMHHLHHRANVLGGQSNTNWMAVFLDSSLQLFHLRCFLLSVHIKT